MEKWAQYTCAPIYSINLYRAIHGMWPSRDKHFPSTKANIQKMEKTQNYHSLTAVHKEKYSGSCHGIFFSL